MILCSSFQHVVVYNFSEIESTFSISFWDKVTDHWYLRDTVSVCLMRSPFRNFFNTYAGKNHVKEILQALPHKFCRLGKRLLFFGFPSQKAQDPGELCSSCVLYYSEPATTDNPLKYLTSRTLVSFSAPWAKYRLLIYPRSRVRYAVRENR